MSNDFLIGALAAAFGILLGPSLAMGLGWLGYQVWLDQISDWHFTRNTEDRT